MFNLLHVAVTQECLSIDMLESHVVFFSEVNIGNINYNDMSLLVKPKVTWNPCTAISI